MFDVWGKKDGTGQLYFDKLTKLVSETLSQPGQPLNELLRRMRETGQGSLYLAGGRLDSEYCLGSDDLGLAISILPDDAAKAAEPGYHPGSTEVYIVFQGSLVLEELVENNVNAVQCEQYAVHAIPPGICHRVRLQTDEHAASLIVKTNLQFKPGVHRCDDCTYYATPDICPLHQRWTKERECKDS